MATVTVRVAPRSTRSEVEIGPDGVVVRVRAAPERGRATDEAARLLARALGVANGAVHLRSGARSRTKVFEVEGLSQAEVRTRLHLG
jgi:hypothetical protein